MEMFCVFTLSDHTIDSQRSICGGTICGFTSNQIEEPIKHMAAL